MPITRSPITACAAAVLTGLLAGCAPAGVSADGPAEVSVVKKPTVPTAGGQPSLEPLDAAVAPGAAAVEWGRALEDVWLPEAVEVTEGIDGTTAETGTVYLTVPADFAVTDAAVRAGQDHGGLERYSAIEVTEEDAATPGAVGTVIDAAADGIRYSVTVSPDPEGRSGFSIVMVRWSPDTPVSIPETASPAPTPDIGLEETTETADRDGDGS